jgi:uncharacterized repeat protein (TIGR04138 family)
MVPMSAFLQNSKLLSVVAVLAGCVGLALLTESPQYEMSRLLGTIAVGIAAIAAFFVVVRVAAASFSSSPIPDIARKTPYPTEAFEFVLSVLGTLDPTLPRNGHIRAAELCARIIRKARESFGTKAKERFDGWSIRSSSDIGAIVYALVDAALVAQTDDESIRDFQDVAEFSWAMGDSEAADATPRPHM